MAKLGGAAGVPPRAGSPTFAAMIQAQMALGIQGARDRPFVHIIPVFNCFLGIVTKVFKAVKVGSSFSTLQFHWHTRLFEKS